VRLEYTAVGSSVILAARLMQNANCCVVRILKNTGYIDFI